MVLDANEETYPVMAKFAAYTNALVAIFELLSPVAGVTLRGIPVNVGLAMFAFNVSIESTYPRITIFADDTKSVVAIEVFAVPAGIVGAIGTPTNTGFAILAFNG